MPLVRHRNLVWLPFVVFFVATVIGGWLNTIDMRGRVVDDFSEDGIANATVTHGIRSAVTASDGSFDLGDVPKTSRVQVDAQGYLRTGANTTQQDIRLTPLAITVVVKEAGVAPDKLIAADIRNEKGDTVLGKTTDGSNTVVSPYPDKGSNLMICAPDHERKIVPAKGVRLIVELGPGTEGCPPLPSPSPTAAPSGSPGASPSGSAAPSPSPSPTATP